MQERKIEIGGIEYTVKAKTEAGLNSAIKMLKKSLKPKKEEE